MIHRYRTFNLEKHDSLVTGFPMVKETVLTLKENNIKVGIVTTKIRNVVNKGLQLMELDNLFDCIITLDDVNHPKPHPEPLQKAMKILDAKPHQTIMVGDNHHDIVGGRNASTLTAGVAWSAKGKDYLQQFQPDFMLDTMQDLLKIVGVQGEENQKI